MFNVNGISSFPYRMMVCALCLSWANVYIMSFCTKYYLLFCVHMLKVFVNLWNWLRNIDNMVFPASRFGSITYLVTALRNILFKPKAKNGCWSICPNLNKNSYIDMKADYLHECQTWQPITFYLYSCAWMPVISMQGNIKV